MLRSIAARPPGRGSRAGSVATWLVQVSIALLLAVVVVGAVVVRSGRLQHVAHVADDQLGVLADHRSGAVRAVEHTGYQPVWPGLQVVHKLTRSPIEYVMRGGQRVHPNAVPFLVVRARDGSRFWFDRVSIQYALDPRTSERALLDSGPNDGFRDGLVDAFARSVLLEEFGRYTAVEIVLPENRRSATERARERLAALLERHGVAVLEVSLSKPRFDERYEQTIERRKVAEQEVERLERDAARMLEGKEEEQRRLERQLELQLAKDSDKWRQELEQLEHAATVLAGGRAEALARLRRERELALEKARADWARGIAQAEAGLAALEGTREGRLRAARERLEREGVLAEIAWERARSEAERALAALAAEHPARLERLRLEGELARAAAESQASDELGSAERKALLQVAAARAAAEQREQLAVLENAARHARATERRALHAREAETFRALAQALGDMGPAGVRAALVQVLAGVEFEFAPTPRDEERGAGADASHARR